MHMHYQRTKLLGKCICTWNLSFSYNLFKLSLNLKFCDYISIDALWMCKVSIFLETRKFIFLKSFNDSIEQSIYTKYFSVIKSNIYYSIFKRKMCVIHWTKIQSHFSVQFLHFHLASSAAPRFTISLLFFCESESSLRIKQRHYK